jgi:hypothetical protein
MVWDWHPGVRQGVGALFMAGVPSGCVRSASFLLVAVRLSLNPGDLHQRPSGVFVELCGIEPLLTCQPFMGKG